MVQLKRNLLSVALASATMMLMAQAHAQSAPAADQAEQEAAAKKKDDAKNLDTVVVTGIRGGIERAIDIKKESTSIVEAISAEDIGKLPDASIAESISRLPGIATRCAACRLISRPPSSMAASWSAPATTAASSSTSTHRS